MSRKLGRLARGYFQAADDVGVVGGLVIDQVQAVEEIDLLCRQTPEDIDRPFACAGQTAAAVLLGR
jgi:hypothetical protein